MKKWIAIYFALHCLCYVNSTNKLLDSLYDSSRSQQQQQQKVDCTWRQSAATEDESRVLSCRMKTISGLDALIRNLTTGQSQTVNALRLECSDALLAESSLLVESSNSAPSADNTGSAFNKHLHELTLQYCKIKYVPAQTFKSFRNLKNLTLQTHNADWSTINLELHADTFAGLSELRRLNLADNNIWTLPSGVFCPLFSLKHLNLSKNHINDVSQVGFSSGSGASDDSNELFTGLPPASSSTASPVNCNTGIERLDLSYNNLNSIPNDCFTALRSLNFLHLDSNQLTILDDRSFHGLERLQFLNLTNNRLITLPPELFERVRDLKRLHIGNNSLAVLAPGLFERLAQLEVLDLSHNELTSSWINRDTFVGLSRLVVLRLNSNKLTKLDQFVFREMRELQALNLESNQLETIAQNAFADLRSLHQLLLSHNKLRVIESRHFAGLRALSQLILESNEIASIHPHAFDNLTDGLVDLSLNDNKLRRVPDAIRKLRNLQALDLGKNQISEIESDSFAGLEQLAGLRLTDNQLTAITKGAFAALKSIHVLNFASNRIRHIDQSAFVANEKLRAIRLDSNALEDIASAFTALPSLVLLNVSSNAIKWFDFSHLPASLEWLDLHANNVTELGNFFDVTGQLRLNYLDVSGNKIRKLKNDLVPRNVSTVNFSNNLIDDIPAGTFLNRRHLRKVMLGGNMIRRLQITSLIVSKFDVLREPPEFFLAGNPLHCDCHLEWLRNINELSEQRRQLPRLLDMSRVRCTMEHSHESSSNEDVAIKSLSELGPNDFLCRYENHCHTLCQCCQAGGNANGDDDNDSDDEEEEECKCKMTCPDQCACYHDNTWNKNIVDCGSGGLQNFPARVPIDVTTLYLDGNNLTHLTRHQFTGKNRLEVLYLNDSNVHAIANGTFDELRSLRVLHLNRNQLRRLHGNEFRELQLLTELRLEHNRLTHIGEAAFAHMKFLRTVDLSDNRLVDFNPIAQLATASRTGALQQVFLDGDNKWNCDCKSLVQLIEWIRHRSNSFNVQRMLCNDNRIVGDVLNNCHLLMSATNVFGGAIGGGGGEQATPPSSSLNSLQQQHNSIAGGNVHRHTVVGGYVPLLAAVLVTVIASALLIALVCIFRQDVKLWAFSKYGVRLGGSSGDDSKKHTPVATQHHHRGEAAFDAYCVYSVNDTDLLTQILLPELQNLGYSVSLFNHHHHQHSSKMMARDNYHATSFLIDTLKAGADASHRLLLVISFNFLQTEWCDSNFRCAMQALIDSLQRQRHRVLLILTVPVQIVQMDPLLALLVRTCTVVCWGEKRFWTKLRYALPDASAAAGGGDKKYINTSYNRYTSAPTSTLQRAPMMMVASSGGGANNPSADWSNLTPVVCSGYSMPLGQYPESPQQQQHPGFYHPQQHQYLQQQQQYRGDRHESYDYEQPDEYHTRGPQSIGGSSTCLGHVYSTIPETPPLSSSSNASSPSLSHKRGKTSHLIEQQHCDAANNDHFV